MAVQRESPFLSVLPRYARIALPVALLAAVVVVASYQYYRSKVEERDNQVSSLLAQLAEKVEDENLEEARAARDEIVAIGHGDQLTFAHLMLAAAYHSAGKFEDAADEYESAIAGSVLVSLRDIARLRLALTSIEMGVPDYARNLLDAVETKSDSFTALVEDRYGDTYRAAGDLELALESYSKAAELAVDSRLDGLAELVRQKIAMLRTDELLRKSGEGAAVSAPQNNSTDDPESDEQASSSDAESPAAAKSGALSAGDLSAPQSGAAEDSEADENGLDSYNLRQ